MCTCVAKFCFAIRLFIETTTYIHTNMFNTITIVDGLEGLEEKLLGPGYSILALSSLHVLSFCFSLTFVFCLS